MQDFPGWTVQFELLFRQEQSRHASGRTRVKDFGTPIWMATYQSVPLRPNALDEWRVRLAALGNGLETFRAWPLSRCWPINAPNGAGLTGLSGPTLYLDFTIDFAYVIPPTPVRSYTVGSIGSDNKSVFITGLPSGFLLSVGDYVQIGERLHQITGLQGPSVQVVPHLSVGATVGQ